MRTTTSPLWRHCLGPHSAIGAVDDVQGSGRVVIVSSDTQFGRAVRTHIHSSDLGFFASLVAIYKHYCRDQMCLQALLRLFGHTIRH